MKMNKFICIFMSSMILLTSFGYARYKSDSLKTVKISKKNNSITAEHITFDCQIFKAKECKKYFNSKSIIKKGYQPVYVSITNNSKQNIDISQEGFNFSVVSAQDVATSLHRNGAKRGVGFGISGALLLFWPLLVVGIVQGCGAQDFNDTMDDDFKYKELNNQVVLPGQTVTGVVFARVHSFNKNFTWTVKNQNTEKSLILSSKQPIVAIQ